MVIVWSFGETLISHSKGVNTMTAPRIVGPVGLLAEALADASSDLMRSLLQTMINALLCAGADRRQRGMGSALR